VQTLYELGGGNYSPAVACHARRCGSFERARLLSDSLPDSAVISGGAAAQFKMKLTPINGFNKSVTLRCQGAPPGNACTASPAQVRLNEARRRR